MTLALIALGSNLGDRSAQLQAALNALASQADWRLVAASTFHETSPAGGPPGQGAFLNAAAVLETALGPEGLWQRLFQLETDLGRKREERWGPRSIDLDLLLYDEILLDTPALSLPHPRMTFRRFVLEPAAEIARSWREPVSGWTIGQLLDHLNSAPHYIALSGVPGVGKTEVASRLAASGGVSFVPDPGAQVALPSESETDSAGQLWARELEFLATRRQALDVGRAAPPGRFVSDFWMGQSLAYAADWMTAAQLEQYTQLWEQAALVVRKPKLLVLLEPGGPSEASSVEGLRIHLAQAVRRARQGPVLRLAADDLPPILEELQAAMVAMQ